MCILIAILAAGSMLWSFLHRSSTAVIEHADFEFYRPRSGTPSGALQYVTVGFTTLAEHLKQLYEKMRHVREVFVTKRTQEDRTLRQKRRCATPVELNELQSLSMSQPANYGSDTNTPAAFSSDV